MPFLSVLMPVKNGERYLNDAVQSTLRALPTDANLVVLDDGSTDQTFDILASLATDQLIVHRNSESQGIAPGLNRLLQLTDSEYVARMDADDITLPWRFRRQLKIASRVDLVFTSVVFMNERGRPTRPDLPGRMSAASAPLHLATASCFSHPTMLARRSAIPDTGYRALAAEDYDLWLRMIGEGRTIARDGVPGLLYRKHMNQSSASDDWWKRRENELADESLLDAYRAALGALGLPSDAPASALRFAMSMVAPEGLEAQEWLLSLNDRIALKLPSLPTLDRLALGARLRSARSRISAGGSGC